MKRRDVFRALMRALPLDVPSPDIVVDDDGDIDLDWDTAPDRTICLSVYESGEIGFAYLIGRASSYGRFVLDPDGSIPDSILCFIRAACAVEVA